MRKMKFVIYIILFLLPICSCSRSYTFTAFSYPPTSKPHEDNWTYFGKVLIWDPVGKQPTEKGKRNLEITIHDRNKKVVLHDKITITSASMDAKVRWDQFKHIEIDLFERGNEYSKDEYNQKLLQNGPILLVTLKYVWTGNQFEKQP
jgi:hypothetical protein